jgi:alkyl hydroperoxide reductase subunit AhpC
VNLLPTLKGKLLLVGCSKRSLLTNTRASGWSSSSTLWTSRLCAPTEIIAFSDRVKEFHDLGAEVVACSTDSQYSHLAWISQTRKEGGLGKMNIPVLSDITKSISRDYGVLIEDAGVALRGLFLVDPKGVLRQITVNDLPVGRSVDETLRLVRAFQFVEEHGEVCPANWQPGTDTIKPDPKGSLDYFKKH